MALNTPILFVIFNRPDRVSQVFAEIKKAKPKRLFIAADGPRVNKPGEKELCEQARRVVADIDWDCEVVKDFSDINLGCSERVYSGINQILTQYDRAIILEDDCLPNQSFFVFCEQMLEKYKDDQRIMMVSGMNWAGQWKVNEHDYHFSIFGGVWGWATWRRSWKQLDSEMKLWKESAIRKKIRRKFGDYKQYWARRYLFNIGFREKKWEYQWAFARIANDGLAVFPSKNLITNIGFGADATHTKTLMPLIENLVRQELNFPLRDNDDIRADDQYDKIMFEIVHPEFKYQLPIILLIKIKNRLVSYLN